MRTLNLDKYYFKSNLLLNNLPEKDLKFLKDKMIHLKFKKGQSIFVEGSYPSGIFYVQEGKVKKYKLDRDGKEQIFYICVSGELFGYPALLSEGTYSDSAAAIENCEIGFISKEVFLDFLKQSPIFSRHLLKNLSQEFNALVNIIAVYSHKSSRERLALMLLILHEKFQTNNKGHLPVAINLSREDLANMVGIAVETLIRHLNDFKAEKVISTSGRKITILDLKKLMETVRILSQNR